MHLKHAICKPICKLNTVLNLFSWMSKVKMENIGPRGKTQGRRRGGGGDTVTGVILWHVGRGGVGGYLRGEEERGGGRRFR